MSGPQLAMAEPTLYASPVPAAAYVGQEFFDLEQQRIFGTLWIFVGMAQLLERENSFLTRVVAGEPVVVQRLDGRLRAFENRCAHRQMPLQWEAMGNRKLICKYHGWAYSAAGNVKAMANSQLYGLEPGTETRLCLREYALRQVGNLIFVCVNDKPGQFEGQFQPEFLAKIEAASLAFDPEVVYTSFDVPWNWKLNFENVLDWNHVQFIHPSSFSPLLDTAGAAAAQLSEESHALAARLINDNSVELQELSYAVSCPMKANTLAWGDSVNRFGDADDFYTWFMYPNVNFSSVHGSMFFIQQFVPKTRSTAEYHLWVTTAKRKDPQVDRSGLLWSLIRGERAVINEDALALSQLQSKLTLDAPRAQHGAYESHIVRMHHWYMRALGLQAQA